MLIYHFVSNEFALENLTKKRLKISEISKLNDPFEMLSPYFPKADDRRTFLKWKSEINSLYGLICYARNWENPVHWSHYGDRHKGVALGFDVPKEALQRVSYESKRVKTDLQRLRMQGKLTEKWMLKVLSAKFKHWAYEQEMRQWIDIRNKEREKEHYFESFGAHLKLRHVVVGHCSPITNTALDKALGDLKDEVIKTKARLAFQDFRVCTQENEKLWSK